MFSKKRIILVISMIMAVVMLVGCSGGEESSSSTSTGEVQEAEVVSKDVTVVVTTVTNTMDPCVAYSVQTSIISDTFYDTLMVADENFELTPRVVSEYTQVDALTYDITIGEGFIFHNGEAMTMDDVIYSIERIAGIAQMSSLVGNLDELEDMGDNVLRLTLKEANAGSFRDMMLQFPVVNKAYVSADPEASGLNPVGTGPFVVTEYIPGSKVVVTKWADYPFEKPEADSITFKAVEEKSGRYIALETGEADIALGLAFEDVERAKANADLNLDERETTSTSFLSMNNLKAPFDNVNIRRAMAYATNKEAFAMITGGSKTIDSMTPSMFASYAVADDVIKYDLEKAKEIMESEGYSVENPLVFDMWTYGAANPVVQAYQAELRSIGVEMTIKNLEFGVFLEGLINQEYQMLMGRWSNTTGNPVVALENYWSGGFGVQNISFYQNDEADAIYDKAKGSTSSEELLAAAQEMENLVASDAPIIPTISALDYSAYSVNLENITFRPSGITTFRSMTFK